VYAEWAWAEHHGFIDAAKQKVVQQYGRGLYLDLHGHGHDIQRLELGYLLRSSDLGLPDSLLDDPELINQSSIRRLALDAAAGFVELVRGATSLGGLLAQQGFPSVPSHDQPDPDGAPYFTGGYSTERHGSRDGGMISGIQIEVHWVGARDSTSSQAAFADALALVLETYLATHFQINLSAASTADSGEGQRGRQSAVKPRNSRTTSSVQRVDGAQTWAHTPADRRNQTVSDAKGPGVFSRKSGQIEPDATRRKTLWRT
jgi:hypothetical protein